ncbi:S-type pyocin domain-containing protein [Pseudomonas fragi]|uniref:S-type pyocin domain-containing protein n=1 Tax=Pseudomonas fragi TaxID=296 RepID=UPI0030A3D493
MPNDVDKYLGPHRKIGPDSYELAPYPIVGKWESDIKFGGGYNSWGLNEGPRRGEGGPSNIHEVAKPNVVAEFMNEQIHNQADIDGDYIARFKNLLGDIGRELQERKLLAQGAKTHGAADSAVIDQQVALELIESKRQQYTSIAPDIYGLYGQSPYFLMTLLSSQKINDFFNRDNGSNPRESFMALFAQFDHVYKSAMALKVLALSTDMLAGKLAELAQQVERMQGAANDAAAYQRLGIINQEQAIHAQQLPQFLHTEFVTAAGSVAGMTASEALSHFKETLTSMAVSKTAEIKPVSAAPPLSRGGITINFPAENPKIKAPLSKPELEALNELVYLQTHTNLGTKWLSYHDALLKAESARHLAITGNSFGGLAERAKRIEHTIRKANTFSAPGPSSATSPLLVTSAGTVAVIDAAAVTLQAAVRSAISALSGLVAGTASGLLVGVSALVYSPKLANGELPERYAFSTPLSDLAPGLKDDLSTIAAANGNVDLPVRISSKTAADGQSEVFVALADGITVPSKVRVVAATFNAQQNVYSVTTEDVPPRTLTWTPIVDPGSSSTTSPAEQPVPTVYTGATVTPVTGRIDAFPGLAEAGFNDFITVFPASSGLPPLYVMFRDPREDAGVATGMGQPVTGIWLGTAAQGEGAPVPSQIADQLRGREFKNFKAFREAFWVEVTKDPVLSQQFIAPNRARMSIGKAAKTRKTDAVGKRSTFEIHHVHEVAKGGDIYNVENMLILTPKRHLDIHKGAK